MSVRVMTLVWHVLSLKGSDLTVMLALADWCDDAGERLFPSINAIARKCRLSKVHARRVVHGLIADRWLLVLANAQGGPPGFTRQYRIAVDRLETARASDSRRAIASESGTTPSGESRTGITGVFDGSRGCIETAGAGESLAVSPTINNRVVGARGTRLLADWTLAEDMKAWALNEQPTWDAHHVATVAANFRDYWIGASGQRAVKLDWDATWRTWVRKEGPKPWHRPSDQPFGPAWRSGGEPAAVIHNALRKLELRPWGSTETHGQARQRVIEAGGEELLRAPRAVPDGAKKAAA